MIPQTALIHSELIPLTPSPLPEGEGDSGVPLRSRPEASAGPLAGRPTRDDGARDADYPANLHGEGRNLGCSGAMFGFYGSPAANSRARRVFTVGTSRSAAHLRHQRVPSRGGEPAFVHRGGVGGLPVSWSRSRPSRCGAGARGSGESLHGQRLPVG